MDGAHVPDLLLTAPERTAHGRLRCADGAEEALSKTETAEARGNGKDCPCLGTLPQHRLLVYVAKSGYQNRLTAPFLRKNIIGFSRSPFFQPILEVQTRGRAGAADAEQETESIETFGAGYESCDFQSGR